MESAVSLKIFVTKMVLCTLVISIVRSESEVKINVGNSTVIDLEAYVADLKIAASSAVYTSNLNLRFIEDLQTALQNRKVFCQSTVEESIIPPLGYERVAQGVLYKLHTEPLTWNSARKKCAREGARLAVFIDPKESESLKKILVSKKISSAFLGVHSLFEDDEWVTISNEPIKDSNLTPQAMKDSSSQMLRNDTDKRCGVITKSNYMKRMDCNAANAFFCEIRSKQQHSEKSRNSIVSSTSGKS
ncbi:hypothetical protein QAD02_010580 [Eretmocerus hayati]|uniref:Uncharacterized protein n=1 Tax=Eretmocerus hayati TaxID=131215 RepID=A0ACC2NWX9_9HYME|nr:hypothetical protein QAD02_010580 [Eretmocerus hayati]